MALGLGRKGVLVLAAAAALGVAVALVILLLGPASPVSETTSSSPPRGPCGGWAIVATRGFWPGGASILSQMAPISSSDAWAVGTTSIPGNIRRTLAEHWDGRAWTRVASPNVGPSDNGLNDAAAVTSKDVWSVGYSLQRTGYQPLALHWNGYSWLRSPIPSGAGGAGTLTGVAAGAADDVWAVGHTSGPSGVAPLALHWGGAAWTEVPVANLTPRGDAGLIDVAQASPDDVWAVGYVADPALRPLVLHWNGARWSRVAAPAPPGQGVLAGVSVSPGGDVWAVGYAYRGTAYHSLTERWDGQAWRLIPSANGSPAFTYLHGVAAASDGNVWAVGTAYDAANHQFRALSEHWDGSSWRLAPTPNYRTGRPRTNILDGVALIPGTNRMWAAGVGAGNTLAAARCVGAPGAPAHTRTAPERTHPDLVPDNGPPFPIAGGGSSSPAPGPPPTVFVPRAADRAAAAGIAQTAQAWTAVTADMNGDGWPDLFIGRHGDAARLYLNDRHGGFTRVDANDFGGADRHGCAAADVNGDGRPDVFCGMGASHGVGIKRDELELQQAGGGFVTNTVPSGLMNPFGRTRRVTFLDANGDGAPDLFIGGEVDRPDGLPAPNRLFLNDGHGTFRDAPQLGLDHQIGTLWVQAVDENRDGRTDLLLAAPGGLHLYRNRGTAGFIDVAARVGIAGDRPISAQMGDLNGDGAPDLVEVFRTRLRVLLQRGGRFTLVYTRTLTDGASVVLADVNGDGRPDIYVVQGSTGPNEPDLMLLNEGDGTRFAPMAVPQATRGTGDTAYALDYDHNGLQDILVLNGHSNVRQGPLQLIAFFRP